MEVGAKAAQMDTRSFWARTSRRAMLIAQGQGRKVIELRFWVVLGLKPRSSLSDFSYQPQSPLCDLCAMLSLLRGSRT
jgi:hypothetical protein